ncbi:MAG TPA: flavodoxin family protein [Methanocella sp.]|uniref:flavodoxin family protein n=1 Tax=Methanocella sp. TaxID=2052833 RepID=UPI002BF83358|nr:flavodoxin family protein [Methanocella sp.]HTY90047.1 flavodoxin family protein [Methanocella sp.]
MKVIAILASPRGNRSFTKTLAESAMKGATEAGADAGLIDITKKKINYCKACDTCYKLGRCVQKDDFNEVYERFLAADGIILASPVYFNSVSAQLKTFIDRTADCRHCLLLEGKYGMSVTTTASSGAERTVDYMNEYLVNSGAFVVGSAHTAMPYMPKNMETASEKAYELGKDMVEAYRTKRQYPEQAAVQKAFIDRFCYVVKANKDTWTAEHDHYLKKGWFK